MKDIVVGCDIQALRYAYKYNKKLIYLEAKKPHYFTSLEAEWHQLYWALSVSGNILLSDTIKSIKIKENEISVIYNTSKRVFSNLNKIYIFDESNIEGLPVPEGCTNDKYEVLDWVSVRSGMSHDYTMVKSTTDFMNYIYFYPTFRVDGNQVNKKDVCVISYLTREEIDSFEASELVVKIKLQELMKKIGIKGTGNGGGKFLSIKLESDRREIYNIGHPIYTNHNNVIEFRPEFLGEYPDSNYDYLNYLLRRND